MLTLTGCGPQNPGGGGGPAPDVPVNVTPASIDIGDGNVGTAATATPGAWTNADTVVGQWQYNSGGAGWFDLSGETALTLTLSETTAGNQVRYVETASNGVGDTTGSSNEETTQPLSSPDNIVAPIASYDGSIPSASINNDLTGLGTWVSNPAVSGYSYQWQIYEFGTWSDIPSATSSSNVWASGTGTELRCVVTAYNSYGGNAYSASKESSTLS